MTRTRIDLGRRSWLTWLVAVLAASAALRIAIIATTSPLRAPDTLSYTELAWRIARLNLAGDQGQRTPTYPLFLVMLGQNHRVAEATQMCLGLLVVAAIFWMVWALCGHAIAAAAAAALYGLNLTQIFFEAEILTEALATFLMTSAAALLVSLWIKRAGHLRLRLALLGICCGLLALTRPIYILEPVVFAVPLLFWLPTRRWVLALFLLPALLPTVAWSAYNEERFGTFGPTTMNGLELTNKTGSCMSAAPAKYAVLRDIYVRALKANGGRTIDLIWRVDGLMMKRTGQSFPELSRTFMTINLYLIAHHPVSYAGNVLRAAADFWKGWGYHPWLPGPHRPIELVWLVERALGALVGIVFLLLLLAQRFVRCRGQRMCWLISDATSCLSAVVLLSCLGCALIEFGSNARFGMPTEPLIFVVTAVAIASHIERRNACDHRELGAREMSASPQNGHGPPDELTVIVG